jgi:hypothetical protein
VLEEEARLSGELDAFDPTPETVVRLRDDRNLRWEAIAVRIFGAVRRIGDVKALYDELKGEGAHRRSYTGRGRRFPEMYGVVATTQRPPTLVAEDRSNHFGVVREAPAPAERLRELDMLRTGSSADVEEYLETHLHSDRFYLDGGRIWLELPNRVDAPPDKAFFTWFEVPDAYTVAGPTAGTRAGLHAVPSKWDATFCRIPLSSWSSGIKTYGNRDVSCRWCEIRLVACRVASGDPIPREATSI